MAELLLVSNPKRRRRRRKMSALQRKYFGKRRRKHHAHRARRRNPRRVHRAHRVHRRRRRPSGARPAQGYVVGRKRIRRLKLNPHRRRYRRHRNPMSIRGVTGAFMPTLRAGGWGALGALGNDAGYGLVVGLINSNLPTVGSYLTNPYIGFLAKAFNAVLVGSLGGKILRGRGRELAVGAMTVVTHDFLKSLLQGMAPTIFGPGGSVPLGAYLSGSAPIVGTATVPQAYLPFSGMGSYLSGPGGSGQAEPAGVYSDDTMGMDPWGGSFSDGRGGFN
jgi:hypothetical protein